jgi:shikimate dehydrogenase
LTVKIKRYGLLGETLKHSFSKSFFTNFFEQNGINASYENFELKSKEEIKSLLQQPLSGLNVTIPYKETVIEFLNELSPEAQAIGAVNCIQFNNGKTIGHNTDGYGFHQSVKPFLTNKHERAIVLGTGGASKAVVYVLKQLGIDCIFISRNPKGENQFGYSDINEYMLNACKLIVNCTPVGMFPNVDEYIELPFEHLTADHLVVDLIYNPVKTQFLQKSEAAGAQILNGETMLKQQALMAWKIWKQNH